MPQINTGNTQVEYESFVEGLKVWVAFYRANIGRWVSDFLNIKLKMFQIIVLTAMSDAMNSMFVGGRGIGKTFLTAIYVLWKAVLFPGSKIVVCAKTRSQGRKLIEKIMNEILPRSPLLATEIESFKDSQYDTIVKFFNTSEIRVVCLNDNTRGSRATVLVLDESRLLDRTLVKTILEKFLTAQRRCGYMDNPEYADYPEEHLQEIMLTSAWYSSNWNYQIFRTYAASMIQGYPYAVFALPYQLALKEKIINRERVLADVTAPDFDSISWQMEMEAEFFEGSGGSLYDYDDLVALRKIKMPIYPNETTKRFKDKRWRIPAKLHNEIRVLTLDVALMESTAKKDNDASSIILSQCFIGEPGQTIYKIPFLRNIEGARTDDLALQFRRYFDEFQADILGIDARGVGMGVLDALLADIYDPLTGEVYGALNCYNNDDIAKRCHVDHAPKVIYAVQATREYNSKIALGLRETIRSGKLQLLQSEDDFEDYMIEQFPNYLEIAPDDKAKILLPIAETTLLIKELISLQYETKSNLVSVKERSSMRNDRYSSLAYNIEIAKNYEQTLQLSNNNKSMEEFIFEFRPPNLKRT